MQHDRGTLDSNCFYFSLNWTSGSVRKSPNRRLSASENEIILIIREAVCLRFVAPVHVWIGPKLHPDHRLICAGSLSCFCLKLLLRKSPERQQTSVGCCCYWYTTKIDSNLLPLRMFGLPGRTAVTMQSLQQGQTLWFPCVPMPSTSQGLPVPLCSGLLG